MEFLNDYLVAVVVGICLCIGYVLKHAIPSDKINRFIPLLMLVLGAIVNVWLHEFYPVAGNFAWWHGVRSGVDGDAPGV